MGKQQAEHLQHQKTVKRIRPVFISSAQGPAKPALHNFEKQLLMTPIRYTIALLLFGILANIRPAQAQCDIQLSSQVSNVLCNGQNSGAIDLTPANGAAPYTFEWSNGAMTEDLNGLVAGTYTCTVTDALLCTATTSAAITQPSPLSISIPQIVLDCFQPTGTLTATASGGVPPYTYAWTNGSTNQSVQVSAPGTYVVTVTDANTCTATQAGLANSNTIPPVACIFPPPTLTCNLLNATIDGTCSSIGAVFTYVWTTNNGHIIGGPNTPTPVIGAPGVYSLLVTNTTNGCTAVSSVTVVEDIVSPIADAGPDLSIPCTGGFVTLAGNNSSIGNNFTYLWFGTNIISGTTTLNPVVGEPGTYTLIVTNTFNGCTTTDDVNVTSLTGGQCGSIAGRVLQDTMANCSADAGEPALAGWVVKAEGTSTYYGVTDADGNYEIQAESGNIYAVSALPKGPLWIPCPAIPNVNVANGNQVFSADDLLFQKLAGCPMLTVDLSSGNLRRCFSNNFFSVAYCNNGTEPAENAFVIITLDPLFTPLGSSLPYINLGNGMYQFDIGDVAVGQCGSFNFHAQLSCNALVGQTFCTEAHIYPDTLCIPPDIQWSGASLSLSSVCDPDSLRFQIKNVGTGNMPNALDYIIIEDQVMLMSAPVQLDAGQSVTVSVPANGSTWRLEMEQEPFHPGFSAPAVSVEGCTTGPTFSTGFVMQFPADDADEFVDINCKSVTASYDPNDKQAFPLGYGTQHYIRPGTPLDYQIRFQNTGNDTAFTVRIVDTLSAWLDPTSIRPGASSHPYTWDLSGEGVLSFLFENILLPDSNVNEPASHGFVQFAIQHKADTPLETLIENTAEIYFDFNDAIVTNTTYHRLGEKFVSVGLWQPQNPAYQVLVAPNPFSDAATLELKGLRQNTPLRLQVFDLQGKKHIDTTTEGTSFRLERGLLPNGMYFFTVEQDRQIVGTGKLIIQG